MLANDLNTHIEHGLQATDPHELAMAASIQALLDRVADEAARNFKQKAVDHLTAAGWGEPHPDEVLNPDVLAGQIEAAIVPHKNAAMHAFAKALPDCIPDAATTRAARVALQSPSPDLAPTTAGMQKPDAESVLVSQGTTLWHASSHADEIRAENALRPSPHGESGPGIYTTDDPKFLTRMRGYESIQGGYVEVQTARPLRLIDRTTPEGEARYRQIEQEAQMERPPGADLQQGLDAALTKAGYDGVRYDSFGDREIVIHNPADLEIQAGLNAPVGAIPAGVDRAYLRSLLDRWDGSKAAGETRSARSALLREIQDMTDMTPFQARKALEAEGGVVKPAVKPATVKPSRLRATPDPRQVTDNISYLQNVLASQPKGSTSKGLTLEQIGDAGQRVVDEVRARLDADADNFWLGNERTNMLRAIVDEVRGSGAKDPFVFSRTEGGPAALRGTLDQAAQVYPTDFLNAAYNWTRDKPLQVFNSARGIFYPTIGKIGIPAAYTRVSYDVAVHELGHLMEMAVPEIRRLEQKLYDERGVGEKFRDYAPGEPALKDKYADLYFGVTYAPRAKAGLVYDATMRSQSFELFTMGMEDLFGQGEFDIWNRDPDLRNFILGILATLRVVGPWAR